MPIYIARCLECDKEFENNYVSPRVHCSVACQVRCALMDNILTNQLKIDSMRDSFDPKLSSKANVLQLLKLAGDNGSHYSADMALLALINDPDIMAAYLDVYREYD